MNKYFVFIIIFFVTNAFSQNESGFNFALQADFTSVIFVNTFSGSLDFDFYKIDEMNYAGLRLGIDRIYSSKWEGTVRGSPFTDIDLLAKLTLNGKYIEVNLCPGFIIHINSGNYREYDNGIFLKGTGELKFKIFKDYVGMILKVALSKEAYGGLGIFLGYNSRDFKKK